MKVTKKLVLELVDEYVEDGYKPHGQLEPRFNQCFDKKSIVDEMHANMDMIENMNTKESLRRLVRLALQMSEEHANMYKRVKVVAEDVAYSFAKMHDAVAGSYFVA